MTSLNSTTLPQVSAYQPGREGAGRHEAMEDGTLAFFTTTTTGVRRVFDVEWWGVTSDQRSTIETALLAAVMVGKAFVPPDTATSYTVVCDPKWQVKARKTAAGVRYWITATLREQVPT